MKLAASSRACSTTLLLLLSGDVVLDEAEVPTPMADEPAVEAPAKAAGATTKQASSATIPKAIVRMITVLPVRAWNSARTLAHRGRLCRLAEGATNEKGPG